MRFLEFFEPVFDGAAGSDAGELVGYNCLADGDGVFAKCAEEPSALARAAGPRRIEGV